MEQEKQTQNSIEELKTKIAGLKRLLKNKCVITSYEVERSINEEIAYAERQLKATQSELTFSKLVGKYFKYHESRGWEAYMFVRKVNGRDVFCDKISVYNLNRRETHIYINQGYGYMNIGNFEEISKDEFFQKYHDCCNNMLESGFGNFINEK